eukprot:1158982-Pelagomonas_calceolata.AAC.7
MQAPSQGGSYCLGSWQWRSRPPVALSSARCSHLSTPIYIPSAEKQAAVGNIDELDRLNCHCRATAHIRTIRAAQTKQLKCDSAKTPLYPCLKQTLEFWDTLHRGIT